jgi:predicted HTH domain antitoxin
MQIEVSEQELGSLRLTPQQAKLELAVGLYAGRLVTLGRAARLAGISCVEFMREIGRRGICINYTVADAQADVETLRQMGVE